MKQLYISLSILCTAASAAFGASAERSAIRFMPESYLASGKWVKITVDRTGVFEISHSALNAMGFANPEAVAVFGRGGRQLDMNFIDENGQTLYRDGLTPVAVTHRGDKLYFYGEGSDEFEIDTRAEDTELPLFRRKNRNIYSAFGYYFLTDSREPLAMETVAPPEADSRIRHIDYGYGMVSHEEDLYHNSSNTGQVFYGERIADTEPHMSWPVTLNDALPGSKGVMECRYYLDKDNSCTWSYGLEEDADKPFFNVSAVHSSLLRTIAPQCREVNVTGNKVTVFTEMNTGDSPAVANLDWWVLTYKRGIPSLKTPDGRRLNQDFVAFPDMEPGSEAAVRIPGGASFMALDVTEPSAPKVLEIRADGADGIARVSSAHPAGAVPRVVVFDSLLPQNQLKGFETGYSRIANQNLHAQAGMGADLVIICIPQLRDVARRLAMMHEEYDGSSVLVATTDECYNEFSDGVPDPMAYRALVKAVYSSVRPCRNVLFIGPLHADARGIINRKLSDECIIAYQNSVLYQEKGAQNANDVHGMMADRLNIRDLHSNDMEVGVGILPILHEGEADIILDKIARFMKEEDMEYRLNTATNVGGLGNDHTHDTQAIQLSALFDRLSDYSNVNSNLPVDAYGHLEAQKRLFRDFDEGRLIVNYYGHGSVFKLNTFGDFFTAAEIYRLRNKALPFMAFAGCSLSQPDLGNRGLGESIVLSTRFGTIGTLLASRETWSGENGLLFDKFYMNLFRDGGLVNSPVHKRPLTIGEVYARTKTQTDNNNELAYQLICDPALILPVVTRRVNFDTPVSKLKAGSRITVTGYVTEGGTEAGIDHSFNGRAVARLMQPYSTYISPDLCTDTDVELRVPVTDVQIAMGAAEVTDGRFSIDLFVPEFASGFDGNPGRIHVAVFSPELHTGGGGLLTGIFESSGTGAAGAEADNYPPVIEHIHFDAEEMALNVRVSDNRALGYCSDPLDPYFRLDIDGREYPAGLVSHPVLDHNAEAYSKTIPLNNLTEGKHTARVTAIDAAGNRATAETDFVYMRRSPCLALRLNGQAARSSALLTCDSDLPEPTDIVILDPDGNVVRRDSFSSSGFEWDLRDSDGRRLPPALYKAYLIETGKSRHRSHSNTVSIPVIGQ